MIQGQNPDFVNFKKRKIIELFGHRWHEPYEQQQRCDLFREHGYDTLIVWDDELRHVDALSDKILAFNAADNSESASHQALVTELQPEVQAE